MKIQDPKRHRKCNGCAALDFNRGRCDLGLEIARADEFLFRPTTKCHKPETVTMYLFLLEEHYKNRSK